MFSQISQKLLNQYHRLGLLMIALLPTLVTYAGSFEVTVKTNSSAAGLVYVSKDSPVNIDQISDWGDTKKANWTSTNKDKFNGTTYAYFKSNEGYAFSGWSGNHLLQDQEDANPHINSFSGKSGTETLVATFVKILSLPKDEFLLYIDSKGQLSTDDLEATISKTRELGIDCSSNLFKITSNAVSVLNGGTEQKVRISIDKNTEVTGEIALGEKKYTITLTPQNSSLSDIYRYNPTPATIYITVRKAPTVTFNPPSIGGSYTYQQVNTDGGVENVTETKKVEIFKTTEGTMFLEATPVANYRFKRWVIVETNDDGTTTQKYVSNAETTYNFTKNTTVQAEFIEDKYARFMVKGVDDVYYDDLAEGLTAAASASSKVLLVYKSGLLAKGDYTIPAGVTLLVPGDDAYTVRNGDMADADGVDYVSPTCYRELIMEDYTNITVDGNISIYATVGNAVGKNTAPVKYGKLAMGNNCHITINSGALFTAYGYVTGDPITSSITAEEGAKVYECFQFTDFRGGTVTFGGATGIFSENGGMMNNSQKVFPMGQYYIQNIEPRLIIKNKAKEYVAAMVSVSSMTKAVTFLLVSEMISGNDEGMFIIGSDAQITKYYDKENDRIRFVFQGNDQDAQINVSYVYLNVDAGIAKKTIDSRKYVLPVTNNIDLEIVNVDVSIPYDMGIYGDVNLLIDKDSKLTVNANAFVYDKEESRNVWYNSNKNVTIAPVLYTPDKSQYIAGTSIYKRQVDDLPSNSNDIPMKDATVIVDGALIVDGGYLYTTASGANITSNGGGKVTFKNVDTNIDGKELYRFIQVAEGNLAAETYQPIAVTNARLHNDETINLTEPYSAGAAAQVGETYTYVKSLGKWILPMSSEVYLSDYRGNEFNLTLPIAKEQDIVCTIETDETNIVAENFKATLPANSKFSVGQISYNNRRLTIPVTYNCQNIHGVTCEENLTIVCEDLADNTTKLETTIPLVATEDYTPNFTVTVDGTEFVTNGTYSTTIIGTGVEETVSKSVVITPVEDNVAKAHVTWIDANSAAGAPFAFAYGSDVATKLTNAQLSYTPTVAGEHSGALTITASYSDANSSTVSKTIEIQLNAKVDRHANTLEFADFPDDINADNNITPPFPLLNMETDNAKTPITYELTEGGADIVSIKGSGTISDPYVVDPIGVGSVTITVKQGESNKVKGTTIWKAITVLSTDEMLETVPLCVDDINTFNIHTLNAALVGFNTTNRTIDFDATAANQSEWIFQFHGVPDQLTFTPSGNNIWNIQERSSKDASWTNVAVWTSLAPDQEAAFALLPTTRQVRIQYGRTTADVGTIKDLCVSELTMRTDVSKLYLPIYYQSSDVSQKAIVLTRADSTEPTISIDNATLSYTKSTSVNLGTADEPYYNDTIVVKVPATTAEGTYKLTATQGTNTIDVTLRAYNFPQELPIKLATDAAERYYFVAAASAYAQWDATNHKIIFQNPGAQLTRSVTFAFNGAPSVIKFNASVNVDNNDWKIYESTNGKDFTEANVDKRTIENNSKLVQELKYTTRYVRVDYNAQITSEITLSNLIIEGYPQVIVKPEMMQFTSETAQQSFTLTAINLSQIRFAINDGIADVATSKFVMSTDILDFTNPLKDYNANNTTHPNALGRNKVGDIVLGIEWKKISALDQANLVVYNTAANDSILAIIPLVGADGFLSIANANNTGIYTGIPDGSVDPDKDYTYHGSEYTDYEYRPVVLTNVFANDGVAMFDYLFIFGETTPADGTDITAPQRGSADGSTNIGSNAITPCYVYKKAEPNAAGKVLGYQLLAMVDNVNTSDKTLVDGIIIKDTATVYIDVQDKLSVYMTGFAPYATTGYSKNDEGVFLFRGEHGDKLDIYLEDCHIFSRNKTQNGNTFYGNKEGGATFSEGYARGSGGVLVFENTDAQQLLNNYTPFEVNIHTTGNNLLKSNYGCFYILLESMKAYQISAPIHVHLNSEKHVRTTKTTLNFDDIWPTAVDENNVVTDSKRTNGYLGLKKQSNNAPSIDLGNPYTVVNFRGGRIEMQNAQIVSDNYKTTLAISYRSGEYGADDIGIKLSYGIGTDSVGGTVNFYDGTTTVEPMWVKEGYKQYYLIDTLADGKEWKRNVGTEEKPIYEYRTSCLRTPKNTYVYGGSHCFMRACQHVTSKGGAPKDGPNGKFLGQYTYTLQDGDEKDPITNLAKKIQFPDNISGLKDHQTSRGYTYGLKSVAPDANNQLHFWIPDGYGGVAAEIDKLMSIWKACMTEIRAGLGGVLDGGVGGDTPIEPNEEVKYFLYCQLDQNIHDVIAQKDANDKYTYKAPVAVPPVAKKYFNNADYTEISPTLVSDSLQYQVLSDTSYTITDKVFYVTTATADLWQTFTAPFDVEKIWVVETFSEEELKKKGDRSTILREQAKHNADFAAFFAVSMAIGTDGSFEDIYNSYIRWAEDKDIELGLHTKGETYTLRSKQMLVPYFGNNWRDANFYLNHNAGNWILVGEEEYEPKWELLPDTAMNDGILLHQGETYSMMFPYCTGCGDDLNNRDWDYWSGKLLIFESKSAPQTINGRDFLNDTIAGHIFTTPAPDNELIVTGNSTFAQLETVEENVYRYNSGYPALNAEKFERNVAYDDEDNPIPVTTPTRILPTTSFLYGELPTNGQSMPARGIKRTGEIIYGEDNNGNQNGTSGHIPTVGGGNDLFITTIEEGINVAVATPQHVRVLSSTGVVIYSGMIQTALDIPLPCVGVYVVSGENEVQKVLY